MNLEELKAQNAEEETETEEVTTTETVEVEKEAADEVELEVDAVVEPTQEESETKEVEAWMQTGSDSPDKKFTDGDMGSARKKYKAKLAEKESEVESLRLENERLKQTPALESNAVKAAPKFSDFDYDEGKYAESMAAYQSEQLDNKLDARAQAHSKKSNRDEAIRKRDTALNEHYQRAEKLAQTSGIEPETYQAADLELRKAMDGIAEGQGDAIVDDIVSFLGDGSERVTYFLGVNPEARSKATAYAKENSYKLMIYLGELKAKLATQSKQTTRAPKPAATIQGDSNSPANDSALKKRYDKAKSLQERMDIKWQAKDAGISVRGW